MIVGSWYDMHTKGSLNDFVALSSRLSQPVKLIMGPWLHGEVNVRVSHSGDAEFGGVAAFDYNDERRRWFDWVLKGTESGIDDDPPVRIFVMGGGSGRRRMDAPTPQYRLDHGGRWRDEYEWPLNRTEWTDYHLSHDGGLTAHVKPLGEHRLTFRFDPNDPVPSVGGAVTSAFSMSRPGGRDQRDPVTKVPLEHRPDVLTFRTAPLAEDLEVTGPIRAILYVSSDGPDTDFTVKLIDEYPASDDWPEGFALNICDGLIRARFREGRDRQVPMEPGTVYEVEVDMAATSNLFVRGHRMRVDVSSSSFPKYDVNPNTGEQLGKQRGTRAALNSLHFSADHLNRIVLPIIPAI